MLDLSPETEALAQRLGRSRGATIDEIVRSALEALEQSKPPASGPREKMSPEVIAKRIAAIDAIVAEIRSLPILDPRPIQEIIDDINDVW